jgi:hypothetical protein
MKASAMTVLIVLRANVGVELAYETDICNNFFKGEDSIIDPNIGLSASDLHAAITAIQLHVDGSSSLSNKQLRSAWEKFKNNSEYLDMDFDSIIVPLI